MSAIVKPKSINVSYLDFSNPHRELTNKRWGWELTAPLHTYFLSSGEVVEDPTQIKVNQKVVLDFGTLKSERYQVLLRANPKISQAATISFDNILEPGEESQIEMIVKADKTLDLTQFEWFLRVYLID